MTARTSAEQFSFPNQTLNELPILHGVRDYICLAGLRTDVIIEKILDLTNNLTNLNYVAGDRSDNGLDILVSLCHAQVELECLSHPTPKPATKPGVLAGTLPRVTLKCQATCNIRGICFTVTSHVIIEHTVELGYNEL